MSRKPMFLASRDRADVDIDLEGIPDGGYTVDLDNEDPNNFEVIEHNDTPPEDRNRPTNVDEPLEVTEEELRGYGDRAASRIKRLTFERETHKRAAEAAVRENETASEFARRVQAENARLQQTLDSTTTSLATNMLSGKEAAMATARAKLAAAHSDGDGEAIADATAEVSALASEITLIKANQPRPRDPNAPAEQPRQPAAPAARPQLEPEVAAWIGRNRWFGQPGGETKTAVAMAVHKRLTESGIKPSSPEYTAGLDKGMKEVFPEHRGMNEQDPPREREPSRRGDIVGSGGRQQDAPTNPRKVVLTATEISLAKRLGVTPQAYAASKVKHQASNKGSAQ